MANAQQGKNPFIVARQLHHKYGGEAITLSGDLTLTRRDAQYLEIDPAADRTVTLPAEEGNEGLYFFIRNTGSAGEEISVVNDAAGAVVTINAGEWAMMIVSAAGAWIIPAQGVGQTLQYLDDVAVLFGSAAGGDTSLTWDSAADSWVFDNKNTSGSTYFTLGTDTNATEFAVRNNSESRSLIIDGSGAASFSDTLGVTGLITATAGMTISDGGLLSVLGNGTSTGDVVARYGLTATEGMEMRVYEETVSPSAVETDLINVPASSQILSVQANVESALTGGGTTVTWSIGTAADPDKYGTAGYPSAADSLAQNSKSDYLGDGSVLTSAEQMVLTGTATGGASDGDTALTVGSVRVRVIYYALNSLDDA